MHISATQHLRDCWDCYVQQVCSDLVKALTAGDEAGLRISATMLSDAISFQGTGGLKTTQRLMDLGTESLEYRFRKNRTRDTGDTTSAFDQVNKETHLGCLRPKVSEICRKSGETRRTQRYLGGICFNETGPLNHLYLDSTESWIQGLYPVQCIYGGVPKRDQRQVGVDWIWRLEIAAAQNRCKDLHTASLLLSLLCLVTP